MFRLASVLLELETDFAHALGALARLDSVLLLALGGSFGAHFLVQFLLTTLTLPLHALHDVDGTALRDLSRHARVGVFLIAVDGGKLAQGYWSTTRERGSVSELGTACETLWCEVEVSGGESWRVGRRCHAFDWRW
jgi:hypothetical protein